MKNNFRFTIYANLDESKKFLLEMNESKSALSPFLYVELDNAAVKISSRPRGLRTSAYRCELVGTLTPNGEVTQFDGKFSMNPVGKICSFFLGCLMLYLLWQEINFRHDLKNTLLSAGLLILCVIPFLFEDRLIARDSQWIKDFIGTRLAGKGKFDA